MRVYQDMMYGRAASDITARAARRRMLPQYCRLDTAAMLVIWRHWV